MCTGLIHKNIIFICMLGLAIFLACCSSTYKITDFSSKNDFYKEVNKSIKNRSVNVILKNDSTFTTNVKGAYIFKNSLSLFLTRTVIDTMLPLSKVKHINFGTNFKIASASIRLKDGNLINAKNVRMSKDSVKFTASLPNLYNIPINKIKKVSYNKRWIGIIEGVPIGFLTSSFVTIGGMTSTNNQRGFFGAGFAIIPGIPLGTILGGIIGWFVGHTYTYQFNP